MIRKLTGPIALAITGGLAITALAAVALRNTLAGIDGKSAPSDRSLKTDVTPVRW